MQLYNALQIDTFQEVNPSQYRGIYIVHFLMMVCLTDANMRHSASMS